VLKARNRRTDRATSGRNAGQSLTMTSVTGFFLGSQLEPVAKPAADGAGCR